MATRPDGKKKKKKRAYVAIPIAAILLYVDLFALPGCPGNSSDNDPSLIDSAVPFIRPTPDAAGVGPRPDAGVGPDGSPIGPDGSIEQEAGSDAATDADSGEPTDAEADADTSTPIGCIPQGTAAGAPTGVPSPNASCQGGEVFWSGSGLGTSSCWKIQGIEFAVTGQTGTLPLILTPGATTLEVRGPGGTTPVPFTITAGDVPSIATVTPGNGPIGTLVTLAGNGFTGITTVTVARQTGGGSASATLANNTGTSATFNVPTSLTPGAHKIDVFKSNCGLASKPFTVDPTPLSSCWTNAIASYSGSGTCSIVSTSITTPSNTILASPFGSNPSGATFTPNTGTPNVAEATGLIILGAGGHTCTLTCIPGASPAQTTIGLTCTNTSGGSCSQTYNRL